VLEAKCFSNCLSEQEREAIKTLLLARIAGGSTDPQTLLAAAKCFLNCIPYGFFKPIQTYLLCQIVNGQVVPPVTNLAFTFNDGILNLPFPNLAAVTMGGDAGVTEFNLTAASALAGPLDILNNPNLAFVSAPLLASIAGEIFIDNNLGLNSINLNALQTVSGNITITNHPLLTSISLAAFLPHNGHILDFRFNALDQPSVDLILARGVASAGFTAGSVSLDGGTNSTPSAAGLANKAILQARGVGVSNN